MRCMRRARRCSAACLAVTIAVAAAGCSRSSVRPVSAAATPAANPPVAGLELAYDTPVVVGAVVVATANGLPAGKTVDLMTFDKPVRVHFSVSADEKWFAWTQLDSSTYEIAVIKNFR